LSRQVKNVVAGVIERDGQLLICQRRRDDKQAFRWEFPGGKIEAGETAEEALKRELREELSIEAEIGERVAVTSFDYAIGFSVELQFFRVASYTGEAQNNVFEQFLWERRDKIASYDFLEADREVVAGISQGKI